MHIILEIYKIIYFLLLKVFNINKISYKIELTYLFYFFLCNKCFLMYILDFFKHAMPNLFKMFFNYTFHICYLNITELINKV